MKNILMTLLLMLTFGVCLSSASAQEWKVYASYHNPTKAVKADSRIFAIANGDLFSYDKEDESVETYDKTDALSDFGIRDIAFSSEAKLLVVLYDNANIDVIDMDGNSWNMPELKNKALQDKTLNKLKVYGNYALVCTNSGLAMINLSKKYYEGFYDLGTKIVDAILKDGVIYVSTPAGTHNGSLASNLLDKANWQQTNSHAMVFPYANFATEATQLKEESDKLLEEVKDISIDSPLRNFFYKLNMQGERLLAAGGNFLYPNISRPATVMTFEDGKWSAFDENEVVEQVGARAYMNATDVVEDPRNSNHHMVGTAISGLYEFEDGKLVGHYDSDNSPLASILPNSANKNLYVRVTALAYDPQGNLWMCNDQCDTIVRVLGADGKWTALYVNDIHHNETFDNTVIDSRGWAWITNRRTTSTNRDTGVASMAGVLVYDTNGTLTSKSDDKHKYITSFTNQDGTGYTPNLYYCVTEDLDGAMWIGTNEGVFVSYEPRDVFNPTIMLSQVKVPRNDGSNLADYLLSSVPVKCITIDGGNRKWVGTLGNGVYLISADGLETIHHFTKENSPLISNTINDIAINGQTGEVFIATDLGLCSFQGDATDPEESMSKNSLSAYPNPVRPEHVGGVHVTGMMANSQVKVVNAAGKLVYEGVSLGGQFNWKCCYGTGKRVASGIYYILATDEDGNKSAFTKVLVVN